MQFNFVSSWIWKHKLSEDLDLAIGFARALSELDKPPRPSFSPIHASTSSHCLGIINIVETIDQASPDLCTLGTCFLQRHAQKTLGICPSTSGDVQFIELAQSKAMEQVSDTRFVLLINR